MPLYEYQCESCEKRFEKIQKFSDPPIETCPQCGGHVKKLLSAPAIQFKGSGFYITDYGKSGSGSNESTSEKADKAGAAGESAAGKSDSKTETKADSADKTPAKKTGSSAKPE